jgi:hypothetical protein
MEHNRAAGYDVYGYELGNEPGCFMPNVALTGEQAALDFGALKALIADVYGGAGGKHNGSNTLPKVVGPDVGGCKHADEFANILASKPPIDVATFHHYVLSGGKKPYKHPNPYTVADFAAAALSNATHDLIETYLPSHAAGAPAVPLWIGEGATTYGQPLDNSFAMLYNYLNILAEGGMLGVSVFIKQSLPDLFERTNHGSYRPTAVFWFAKLWKQTLGRSTIVRRADGEPGSALVVAGRGFGLAIANLNSNAIAVSVPSIPRKESTSAETDVDTDGRERRPSLIGNIETEKEGKKKRKAHCGLYLLEPTSDGSSGTDALINGVAVSVGSDGKFPPLEPKVVDCDAITLPPMAIGFVVQ